MLNDRVLAQQVRWLGLLWGAIHVWVKEKRGVFELISLARID